MGSKDIGVIARIKIELATIFEIVDMRPISFYLNFKIEQN